MVPNKTRCKIARNYMCDADKLHRPFEIWIFTATARGHGTTEFLCSLAILDLKIFKAGSSGEMSKTRNFY